MIRPDDDLKNALFLTRMLQQVTNPATKLLLFEMAGALVVRALKDEALAESANRMKSQPKSAKG